jgi:Helitron helicase-like domain at N-terminus
MFSRDLECRLHYIRINQLHLHAAEEDSALMGIKDVSDTENIYLPSSFLGSWRWLSNRISDSLAIAAAYSPPTFLITMTCNADWPEIQSQLRQGQNYTNILVVICHVFKLKLSKLFTCLRTMFPNAGHLIYILHSIEF